MTSSLRKLQHFAEIRFFVYGLPFRVRCRRRASPPSFFFAFSLRFFTRKSPLRAPTRAGHVHNVLNKSLSGCWRSFHEISCFFAPAQTLPFYTDPLRDYKDQGQSTTHVQSLFLSSFLTLTCCEKKLFSSAFTRHLVPQLFNLWPAAMRKFNRIMARRRSTHFGTFCKIISPLFF